MTGNGQVDTSTWVAASIRQARRRCGAQAAVELVALLVGAAVVWRWLR